MRIADSTRYLSVLNSVTAAELHLNDMQLQISTGKRINTPSDDPAGTATLLRLNGQIADDAEGVRVASTAGARLNTADSALSDVAGILQSARSLGVQAQNGSLSAGGRQAIGTQLNQLLLQAVQDGNTSYAGQYVFAGAKTTTPPFSAPGASPASVTYAGDDTALALGVTGTNKVRVDVPGDQALSPVFSAIVSLRDAVNNGDSAGTATAITSLDSALDSVDQTRASIGARVNTLTSLSALASNDSIAEQAQASSIGDVDVTSAVVQFNEAQNAYQASLGAASKLFGTNLLSFLQGVQA